MDFLAYVPAAVRAHISTLIEGDSWEPTGWQESLASAERQLTEIDGKIENCTRWGKDDYLSDLMTKKAEAVAHRDSLASDIDCLRRLAHDPRMPEAFALLTREFTDDKQWRSFIYAAWAARVDFTKYRDRFKRVAEMKIKIADTAERLANLIRQFADTGIDGPSEFYSISELLRQTDNYEMQGYNLYMWRAMRRHILGDPTRQDVLEEKEIQLELDLDDPSDSFSRIYHLPGPGNDAPGIVISFTETSSDLDDPIEQERNAIRYGWGTAPHLPSLLDTVAKAAQQWKPSADGFIDAAIASRQRSPKTEYLRAFGNLLIDIHKFTLTTPIMRAIATTANVVINLPDVDVTYDDVRKALAKLGS